MGRASASPQGDVEKWLTRARDALADGDRDEAVSVLDAALRSGLWKADPLWFEFTTLPHDVGDYRVIRSLWWDSPRHCHRSQTVMLTVARSAAVASEHRDARILLRKAILSRRAAPRWPSRLRGLLRERVEVALPGPGIEPRDRDSATTLLFFGLHHALGADGSAAERSRLKTELAQVGEGDWLSRVG